jgi:hypothetical protein
VTNNATVVALHGVDHAPTRTERELFDRALDKLMVAHPDGLPHRVLAAELVALGVPTVERAKQIIDAHFAPGGLPPLDEGGVPSVQWLIQKHSTDMETMELLALIQKHHPSITVPEIVAELRKQAADAQAEADALQGYARRAEGD